MSKNENSKKLSPKYFKEKYNKLNFLLKDTKYNKLKFLLKDTEYNNFIIYFTSLILISFLYISFNKTKLYKKILYMYIK